jgi:ABC-type transporter Mla subunit MlaD
VRRAAAIAAVLLAAAVVVVFATGADGGDDGAYRVRAIFMNAFSIIEGEDVRVAGVNVGKIEAIDVTDDHRAAVVLRIDEDGFQDFRRDAECSIRPQSLIGEKYVECTPTQPRPEGTPAPPPLRVIEDGDGEGQRLLPVTQTNRPVDLDLVNNVMRLPYRQRFAIILNELGTGLAGRGRDLRVAIRNADPALKETDKVLAILARQNEVLADLARDGDRILRPLARERGRVASFVERAGEVATATAERDRDLEANVERLPAFLRELRPTMQRLGALSDEMTPVLSDLGAVAPDVNRFVQQLGPFSRAGIPAFRSLGEASDVGREALVRTRPILEDVRAFIKPGRPLARDLERTLTSLRRTGGIESLMDFFFYQVAATNGYDAYGHYLRAALLLPPCTNYRGATEALANCTARFTGPGSVGELQGASASAASSATASAADAGGEPDALALPRTILPEDQAQEKPPATAAPAGGAGRQDAAGQDAAEPLLDYLLGGGA